MSFWEDIVPFAAPIVAGTTGGFLEQHENQKQRQQEDEMFEKNAALQREFARMGIRWKVEDAKAAGIHPLAALGASTHGASPSFQVGEADHSMSNMVKDMGQNVSRAMAATQTAEERMFTVLRAESLDLDNQLKQVELDRLRQVGPSFPKLSGDPWLMGQGDGTKGLGLDDGRVIDVPFQRVVSEPRAPHKESGAISDMQIVRTKGGYAVVPGRDVKTAIEDSPMEWQWLMRNMFRIYNNPESGRPAIMNPFTGQLFHVPFTKGRKNRKSNW